MSGLLLAHDFHGILALLSVVGPVVALVTFLLTAKDRNSYTQKRAKSLEEAATYAAFWEHWLNAAGKPGITVDARHTERATEHLLYLSDHVEALLSHHREAHRHFRSYRLRRSLRPLWRRVLLAYKPHNRKAMAWTFRGMFWWYLANAIVALPLIAHDDLMPIIAIQGKIADIHHAYGSVRYYDPSDKLEENVMTRYQQAQEDGPLNQLLLETLIVSSNLITALAFHRLSVVAERPKGE